MYYVLYNFYMNVLYTGMDREEGLHTLEGIWIELDTIILKMWNKKCHLSKTEILGCRDPRYKHENSSIFSKSMEWNEIISEMNLDEVKKTYDDDLQNKFCKKKLLKIIEMFWKWTKLIRNDW